MACNKCGHQKSSPCACHDHGLTTPCSYTNCNDGTPCEEVICSECIVDCTEIAHELKAVVWDAETSTGSTSTPGLRMRNGDSVAEMLQRTALFAADPGGSGAATIAIAPLKVKSVGKNQVELKWSGVDPTVTSIELYKANANSNTWTFVETMVNATNSRNTVTTKTILGLISNTSYKFKLISKNSREVGSKSTILEANSVAVYAKTL